MAEQKLQPTTLNIDEYIDSLPEERRRNDAKKLLSIFKKSTKLKPVMWSHGMIGFGNHHYKYASGHEGDCFLAGFAPRKGKHSLYLSIPFTDPLYKKLGKYKHTVSCLYINKLDDVNIDILQELIQKTFKTDPETLFASHTGHNDHPRMG
jgi:hypothetical protein